MRARDIMTTPVVTVRRDHEIKECARLLAGQEINALPVVEGDGTLVGIVSEKDLLPFEAVPPSVERIIPLPVNRRGAPSTAEQVMTRDVVTFSPDAEVSRVAWTMVDRHLKTIPIVEAGRVVGIVSRRDLLRVLCRPDEELRFDVQAALDAESSVLGDFHAIVTDGHVTLFGYSQDRIDRRLAEIVVRRVPGVLSVAFAASEITPVAP